MVVLDGAHNVDGIRQLSESIETYFKDKKITIILGVLGDKEYEKMSKAINPYGDGTASKKIVDILLKDTKI